MPVLVLALGVRVLASDTFLRWEYGRPSVPLAIGLANPERLVLAGTATRYVVGRATRDEVARLRDGARPFFTAAEIAHLADVQRRVAWLQALALVGGVLLFAMALAWRTGHFASWPRAVELGGWLTLGLVLGVGVMVVVAWPVFFVGFHQLLFAPGTWQFPAESGLIRLFPERFWIDVAAAMLALGLVGGLLAVGLGRMAARMVGR